ncbi:MAG TPA: hypothetical protein VHE35_34810 [Kofleriaceae bacterium]|nr:hypothetical protein [Kofleriaceae bacterium]
MKKNGSLAFVSVLVAAAAAAPALAHAHPGSAAQACTIATAGVGQPANLVCKDVASGETTQSVHVAPTVSAAGGVGGNLTRAGDRVLVTNQAGGATIFREHDGRLTDPVALDTGGEGSLSGYLDDRGAYVLTGTRLLFFPHGSRTASSARPLLAADGSAAQVTLAGGRAYVSEKSRSLEAFRLAANGNLAGAATAVAGVPAGTIVGIAGSRGVAVAPIAHLATNFNQSAISVVGGAAQLQLVPTKEVAACWAKSQGDEVCVSNPGSMTVSCGRVGDDALASYTSAAASPTGDAIFDLDLREDLVAIQATAAGAPMLLVFSRDDDDSDFLSAVDAFPVGTAAATGALLLPGMHH